MNILLRIVAWFFAVALVVAPIAAVLNGWIAGSRWPMRHLTVTAPFHQVSDVDVRRTVLPLVQHGFFAVDLEQLQVALGKLPWVQRVVVRKRWPDRLEVSLAEFRPMAHWGKDRMLSENGEIFPTPSGMTARLPHFEGPDDRTAEVMAFHSVAKPLFLPGGLHVTTVRLSERGSWNLSLSDGTEIEVGRGDPQQRLARFARMIPRLHDGSGRPLQRADLRYTNGFSLTWGEPVVATSPVVATQAES